MKQRNNNVTLSPEHASIRDGMIYDFHEGMSLYRDIADRLDQVPQLALDQELRDAAYATITSRWNITGQDALPSDFWFLELFGWLPDNPRLNDFIKEVVKKNAPIGASYERQPMFLEKILAALGSSSAETILFYVESGLFREAFTIAGRDKKLLSTLSNSNPSMLSAAHKGIAARLESDYFNEARAALERFGIPKNDAAILTAARSSATAWKNAGNSVRAQEIAKYFGFKM